MTMTVEHTPGGTVINNPDREYIAMLSLKTRLKLEIDTGMTDPRTMKACRGWGFKGRTRKQALEWATDRFNKRLRELSDGAPIS